MLVLENIAPATFGSGCLTGSHSNPMSHIAARAASLINRACVRKLLPVASSTTLRLYWVFVYLLVGFRATVEKYFPSAS